jgi:hypothetical protein
MNLQENIRRILKEETKSGKYISALEDLTEYFKNEDCVCDIEIEYRPEEFRDAYLITVVLGNGDLDDKFNGISWRISDYRTKLKRKITKEVLDFLPIPFYVEFEQTPRCYKDLQESENKKSSLLSSIEQNGLFQVMQDTGLSLPKIYTKTGELPREVFERYIKDYIDENGYEFKGRKNISPSIQINDLVWVDYIYTSDDGNKLYLEISEFKNGNLEEPTDVYITSLDNIDDEDAFNIVDHITQIDPPQLNESENKKSRLLSTIEEDGLYQVMKDTSLSLQQVISKTGELSREVLERYIMDFMLNEAVSIPGSDGDIGFVFPVPLSTDKEAESFYLSKGVVTVEINEYGEYGMKTSGSHERLVNLSDDEIYKIVKEMIVWGEDTYYEL